MVLRIYFFGCVTVKTIYSFLHAYGLYFVTKGPQGKQKSWDHFMKISSNLRIHLTYGQNPQFEAKSAILQNLFTSLID